VNFRLLLFAVIVGLTTTLSSGVWAQASITIDPNMVIGRRDGRPTMALNAINYADCIAGDFMDMTVRLNNVQGGEGMEVWVGTEEGCASSATRGDLTANQCWLVHRDANAQNNVHLLVQNVIPHNVKDLSRPGNAEDCEGETIAGSGDIKIYFILTDGDNEVDGAAAAMWPAEYDLKGPSPAKPKGLGIGDTRLYPEWEPKDPLEDTKYLRAYCEATDPGAGVNGAPCTAPSLVVGEPPPANFPSAQTSKGGTNVEVKDLMNYQRYACGLATEDELMNVGVLSPLMCGTPQPVVGYYKAYRNAGGQAGGGWCSYGHRTTAGALSLSAFGLFALFLAGRRRRRETQ
jgi:MYXO-CTERM domain-containing protein